MKKKQFKLSALVLAMAAGVVGSASAYDISSGNNVGFIYTDNDESGDPGLVIRAGDNGGVGNYFPYTIAEFGVNGGSSAINTALSISGATSVGSSLGVAGATTIGGATSINNTLGVSGATTIGGATSINNTLGVSGATTLQGATSVNNILAVNANGGSTELSVGNGTITTFGTLTQTGTTDINTTGSSATAIGSAGNTSAVSIYSGGSTIQASNGTNTLSGTINNISGVTSINASVNSATNINTGTSTANVTIGNALNTTTIQSGTNVITGAANSMLSSGGNIITAATTNAISAVNGNSISATGATGVNTMTAVANNTIGVTGNGSSNNLLANAAGASNNISATGTGGSNNVSGTTNVNVGTGGNVNNFATNINTGTNTQAVSIGNSGMSNTNLVTARSGNTTMSLTNNVGSLTAGTTLGTNGTSGMTSASDSGGITVYNFAQTIQPNTSIPSAASPSGVLAGKQYQNQINGNLFVDGNVYINGTLDYVSRNAANTTVIGNSAATTSNLVNATSATSGGMAVVMKGTDVTTTQSVVDANGRITNVPVSAGAVAAESTAALTLTNGFGDTHGVVVTESQTTLSGGTSSTSLTLNDNGATFSNASTGAPVRVHGVYDGRDDFDAVNVRQLGAGVAMASALAAMPQVDANKRFNLTAGVGNYLNTSALAIGGSLRVRPSTLVRFGAAFSTNRQRMVNVGVGHSF